ncbi:hypothetical protein ACJ41O_006449 [Fusarium nematophilum]
MTPLRSVAVIGGTGYLGRVVVERLAATGSFDIAVITRQGASGIRVPSNVKVLTADYDSEENLSTAFRGFEAVVCALPGHLEDVLLRVLNAAIGAGVKRYFPSEFGLDHRRPAAKSVPLATPKINLHAALAKAAEAGKIEYTSLVGGPWIEFLLEFEGAMCVKNRTFYIHDGGNLKFSLSSRAAFGDAIAGALRDPDQTKNEVLSIEALTLTQNEILDLVKQVLPDEKLNIVDVETEERYQEALQKLFAGDSRLEVIQTIALKFAFNPDFHVLPPYANELLGVTRVTEGDFKEIIASLA